jgi:hypothetical protein
LARTAARADGRLDGKHIMCVVRALSFFGEEITKTKPKTTTVHPSQKERFFDYARIWCSWNRQKNTRPKQNKTKQKQHKNTSKHERYENSSLIDIPDDEDAFFERT